MVKHAQPNLSDLGLGRGPPAPESAEQDGRANSRAEEARPKDYAEAQQEPDDEAPQVHVPDSDEFRNVWDGDRP